MIWFSILMSLLTVLLNWLITKKSAGLKLSEAETQRLNGFIFRVKQILPIAVGLGCDPNGLPPMEGTEEFS